MQLLHPLQGIACDASVEEAQAVPGAGITALVDGRRVAAGTPALLASAAGVAGAEVAAAQAALEAEGGLVVFWGRDYHAEGGLGWAECCVAAAVFQDAVCWESLLCDLHIQGHASLCWCFAAGALTLSLSLPLVDRVQAPTGCFLPDRLPSV